MENKNEILKIIESHNINGFQYNGGTDKAEGHSYDIFYSENFKKYKEGNGTLLEIGVQYGGSSLLWHDYLPNFKIVMTDIHNQVHNDIWEKMDTNRYEYINMDAFNDNSINILSEKYPEGFDIIVEDGPHTIETQIFALKHYSKLLKKGGILVIEDIQRVEYIDMLLSTKLETEYESLELVDLRHIKNRYDDLLIVLKK
jgi:predicted O-methyltransferase YrrM